MLISVLAVVVHGLRLSEILNVICVHIEEIICVCVCVCVCMHVSARLFDVNISRLRDQCLSARVCLTDGLLSTRSASALFPDKCD